jgi:hypothetical protein
MRLKARALLFKAFSSRAIFISDALLLFIIMLEDQALLLFYKRPKPRALLLIFKRLEPHYYPL